MKKKTRKSNKLDLRVDLKGEIADILEEIIDERKFQTYAEAVRFCIIETYTKSEFALEEPYLRRIKQVLELEYVRNQVRAYDISSFINKSLDAFLDDIISKRESILSFNVRQDLTGDELEIAQAFIELQQKSESEQVTAQAICDHMNLRNVNKIESQLDAFVTRGILDRIQTRSMKYYHAFQS